MKKSKFINEFHVMSQCLRIFFYRHWKSKSKHNYFYEDCDDFLIVIFLIKNIRWLSKESYLCKNMYIKSLCEQSHKMHGHTVLKSVGKQ